jgi:hypothetical protein
MCRRMERQRPAGQPARLPALHLLARGNDFEQLDALLKDFFLPAGTNHNVLF